MTHPRELEDDELVEEARNLEEYTEFGESAASFKLYNTAKAAVFYFDNQDNSTLTATFELNKSDSPSVQQTLLECQLFRMEKQPYNQPSCGSVFKNPPNDYAARLIELSKLKGKIRGRAQISPKHANFIVNLGDASSDDILWLMDQTQEQVFRDHNIELIPEVQILQ